MKTQKSVLTGIAKAIKSLDEVSFNTRHSNDVESFDEARRLLINILFANDHELNLQGRLVKSLKRREPIKE